jgi:excisionase family DNA binding protein
MTQRKRTRLMSQLFVSPTEAAQLCGVGRATLYRMISRGEVPVQYFRAKPRVPVAWIRQVASRAEP